MSLFQLQHPQLNACVNANPMVKRTRDPSSGTEQLSLIGYFDAVASTKRNCRLVLPRSTSKYNELTISTPGGKASKATDSQNSYLLVRDQLQERSRVATRCPDTPFCPSVRYVRDQWAKNALMLKSESHRSNLLEREP